MEKFWERLLDPRAGLVIAAVLFLIEGLGAFSDSRAAAVLTAWCTMATASFIHKEALGERDWLRGVLAGLAVIAVLVPVGATLMLGNPAFEANVHQGDVVNLPDSLSGPVRILIHGRIAGGGDGVIDYRLEGLDSPVTGKLERASGLAKIGRRRVQQSHTHDTELVSAKVGDSHEMTVALARGALDGPLVLTFYPEHWPFLFQLLFAAIFIGFAAFIAWRRARWDILLPAAVTAASFGIFAYRWLAPGNYFRPEMGAMIVGAACGLVAHIGVRWVSQKLGREIHP